MADLASWLLEQIAQDDGFVNTPFVEAGRWDAERAAKRAIVDEWRRCNAVEVPVNVDELRGYQSAYYRALRLLAQPYADRPGYDPAWRP